MKSTLIKYISLTLFSTILFLNLNCSEKENPVEQIPPVVQILNPLHFSNHGIGDTISFTALITYQDSYMLEDSLLVWSSDIDGIIGTGTNITTNSLTANKHTISLTASRSDSEIDTAQITLTIFITFKTTFGTEFHDKGEFGYQLSDGSYIITGSTQPLGTYDTDVYLLKVDKNGNLLWENSYGGVSDEFGRAVCEADDGGYLIFGYIKSDVKRDNNFYLIKTDSIGTFLWEKTYGGNNKDEGYFISSTSDGGYILTGATSSFGAGANDVYLIKIDNLGNKIWEKTFGGLHSDYGSSVKETSDGGFIVSGGTISYGAGNVDVYLIKTDNNGNMLWEIFMGGIEGDYGNSVCETANGDFIIAGSTSSTPNSGSDVHLLKYQANGTLLWTKRFESYDSGQGYSVCITSDGAYVVTGYSYTNNVNGVDVYLLKTNSEGTLIWEKTFSGIGWDEGLCVNETLDGGLIITGHTTTFGAGGSDVYLIKTDSEGNVY